MMGRVRWSHVTIALALIAALAIAAPAIGGPSLKKLVKKEVAKQIAKATGPAGPAGPPGANGTNGTNGLDGTARAYAEVSGAGNDTCTGGCTIAREKGVTIVNHVGTGLYCVTAPGINPNAVSAAVSVETQLTDPPLGNASAMTRVSASDCPAGDFEVVTQRQPSTAVRNAADTGSIDVAGNAVPSDVVDFTIVIP